MEIYLEEVIFLNACINYSFLLIISYAFHFKLNIAKSILGSIISSIFSFIFSFTTNTLISYTIQLIITLFLISFSISNCTTKKLFQSLVLFVVVSNVFNGMVCYKFLVSNNGNIIYSPLPIYLFLIILILFTYLLRKCFDIILLKAKTNSNICKIELTFNNKKISTSAFLDTGNNLNLNNKPVSIINFKLFNSLTGISLSNFLAKNYSLKNQEFVEVATITGRKKLLSFELQELKIKSKKTNHTYLKPSVAISLQFNNSKDYDIILNNYYLN